MTLYFLSASCLGAKLETHVTASLPSLPLFQAIINHTTHNEDNLKDLKMRQEHPWHVEEVNDTSPMMHLQLWTMGNFLVNTYPDEATRPDYWTFTWRLPSNFHSFSRNHRESPSALSNLNVCIFWLIASSLDLSSTMVMSPHQSSHVFSQLAYVLQVYEWYNLLAYYNHMVLATFQ